MHALAAPLEQGADAALAQKGAQVVAPLRFDLVILEDVHVRIAGRYVRRRWQHHLLHVAQIPRIPSGQLAASRDFLVDVP